MLISLPRKYQADSLTFDEAALVAVDFSTEQIAEGIADCRREGGLPFPQKVRAAIEARSPKANGHGPEYVTPYEMRLRAEGKL